MLSPPGNVHTSQLAMRYIGCARVKISPMIPLIVDFDSEWRGGQSQALLLLKGLRKRGHPAELVATKGSPLACRAKQAEINVHEISRRMLRLSGACRINRLLGEGRFDLLHANEAHALTAAWLAGAHRRLPLLCSRRIGFPLRQNWVSRARFQALDVFVANSKSVAQSLIDSGFPKERIAVVNEGGEIPEPVSAQQRRTARKQWRVADDEFLFGCAAAFVREKGQRHAVEALSRIIGQFPKTQLLLAGEGSCFLEVKKLAKRLDLQDAVLMPGFVDDMHAFYRALDAFVFPSEFEGLGTALQTAMAYSLPVISTTRGALGEVVDDGRTGLVAEPDAGDFAAAMIRLLNDDGLRMRLGNAGRQEIINRFSEDRMVEGTLRLYGTIMSRASKLNTT
jgi:glycosyltransferase involved in cell wall biosynthesis